MANPVNLSNYPLMTQGGQGATPGYSALDLRRMTTAGVYEGIVSATDLLVSLQSGMNVEVAAGEAFVQGDAVTNQGNYYIRIDSVLQNITVPTADATNPRIDRVVLEVLDNQHDLSGSNVARVRVVAGTPTSGATLSNLNGIASLPNSAMELANVLVPAGASSILAANIQDRRPKRRGVTSVAGAEAVTSTTYTTLATPDVVRNIVVPSNGILMIQYDARWQNSVNATGRAALFIGSNQLKAVMGGAAGAGPVTVAAVGPDSIASYTQLTSANPLGLIGSTINSATGATGSAATTGQTIGGFDGDAANGSQRAEINGTARTGTAAQWTSGVAFVTVAAGTYDISVQFKSSSGSVTVKERTLLVAVLDPTKQLFPL